MKGYMYILLCSNGKYYTGSTKDLEKRWQEHLSGNGANFTKKYPPVKLLYYEEYDRIDEAFYREKQVQGWGRKKKEALINGEIEDLHNLAECKNESHYLRAFRLASTKLSTSRSTPGGGTVVERSRNHRGRDGG